MTPKEKAEELQNKYFKYFLDKGEYLSIEAGKQFALIAVDEIINTNPFSFYDKKFHLHRTFEYKKYWEEVKQEIEKL